VSRLRIATRRSPLALWQAHHVKAQLEAQHAGLEVELLPLTTAGDRLKDRPLAAAGGKGLFIKELERALETGQAELAVHSMKDVPWRMPDGLVIGAVLARADPRDAFVSLRHASVSALPARATVGTSSQRRAALLRALRPDLEITALRGNVETRLARLDQGRCDAVLLAAAGLARLKLEERITEYLDPAVFVPAVGQGVIGVECRDDAQARDWLLPLEHAPTRICLDAERAFAQALAASCTSPIAAHARLHAGQLALAGFVGAPDGQRVYRAELAGPSQEPQALGRALADRLQRAGAAALLAELAAAEQ
jgi:hydroxymethylbilane synthase